MKEYYDFLKEELTNFEGNFPKYVLHTPDFFKLLCKLTDEDLKLEDKKMINSALAYFVIPNDVIPEDMYGPAGYIDDIFVCTYVLMNIRDIYGIEMLKNLWEGEEDIEKVFETSYKESKEELKEKGLIDKVLKVACLRCDNE